MKPAINCTIFSFFFQAEDGIRYLIVTGVQTCALPCSRNRFARMSTWNWTSSSRSREMRSRELGNRNTRRTPAGTRTSGCLENAVHGARVALPRRRLGAKLRAAVRGERVVLRPAIVLRHAPLGDDRSGVLEAVERLVERGIDDHELA